MRARRPAPRTLSATAAVTTHARPTAQAKDRLRIVFLKKSEM